MVSQEAFDALQKSARPSRVLPYQWTGRDAPAGRQLICDTGHVARTDGDYGGCKLTSELSMPFQTFDRKGNQRKELAFFVEMYFVLGDQ